MIRLNTYSREFEDIFYDTVKIRLADLGDRIVTSSKAYLPPDFYGPGDALKQLVLAPFAKLKGAMEHMHIGSAAEAAMKAECFLSSGGFTGDYQLYHDTYGNLITSMVKSKPASIQMNVKIVRECGISTCPYCNRDFINSRAEKVSGAQLDHFYSRSAYPFFAVSLYNLVPVCGNCNRVKSASTKALVSPFDDTADFVNGICFSFSGGKIKLTGTGDFENNVKVMRLEEAYQIHDVDAIELIRKSKVYTNSQLKEIQRLLVSNKKSVSMKRLEEHIFGKGMTPDSFGRWPLSKFKYDILKETSAASRK